MNLPLKHWPGKINKVKIGKTKEEGGTRNKSIIIGGCDCLPGHTFEGTIPNMPVIALEVTDIIPEDWLPVLKEKYSRVLQDPIKWAHWVLENYSIDLICFNMRGAEKQGKEKSLSLLKDFVLNVPSPIILKGPGESDFQDDLLARCAEITAGEGLLLASATQEHHKTIAATAIAYGHSIVAETPIDVNLAKQLNILLSDMKVPPDRIVIDPLTGGLGYGLEYTYSVMERIRISALKGDSYLQMPFINFIGDESWKVKEVKIPDLRWGDTQMRGVYWEVTNAMSFLLAGSEILVLRHPDAVKLVRHAIKDLMTGKREI